MFFRSLILGAGVFFISVPSIASAFDVGLGVGAHVRTFDAAGQEFTKELGPHSIRAGYGRKGDFVVNWAAQKGKSVLFMLGYGDGIDVKTASGRQAYADRSAQLAQTYGNKVKYYEVWNEWNGGFGLGKLGWNKPPANDAAMYTDLLCRTYKAIKAVRPSAIVVGGAVAGANEAFLTGMLNAGAGNCMDMLSIHLYVYRPGWPGHVAENAPGSVGADKFIQVATDSENLVRQKTGKTIPILVTEAGFHGDNEQVEADYITQLYKRAAATPFIEGIWWFQLRQHRRIGGKISPHGLVRFDNTKKPSFAAFQAAAKRLISKPLRSPSPPTPPASSPRQTRQPSLGREAKSLPAPHHGR